MAKEYTQSEREMMEKLGLTESDFEPSQMTIEEKVAEVNGVIDEILEIIGGGDE